MNHRLLIRVTAPAVLVGLLLFGACLASIRYIERLQKNLAEILAVRAGREGGRLRASSERIHA